MATNSASLLHLPSPSFFPLLSSKTCHSLPSPLSQQYPYSHSLYHSTFPTVSSRQTPPHRLMSMYGKWVFNSLTVRSESEPSINREPMLPPYHVLITGPTKETRYCVKDGIVHQLLNKENYGIGEFKVQTYLIGEDLWGHSGIDG
ncbi:uncharacterized protein LOC112489462 [Ziziphus jujuba]|uniref:Uncharacterized protein LOC112489462 n=1 Tax=Ziziphus jujuba TaxID=326968 RepID=A0ABM4AGT2_ZIZJJ|nr:uncharacterized protein LOC112489462 [Ziziphus jujuba]